MMSQSIPVPSSLFRVQPGVGRDWGLGSARSQLTFPEQVSMLGLHAQPGFVHFIKLREPRYCLFLLSFVK